MSLIFYTNPMSRGRIVRRMLEEVGAQYETRVLEYGPAMKAPEFLALNPMGKIPVLCHDGVAICETPAILAHLADAFPQAQLAPPPGSPLRGAYYRWLFFGAGPIEAAMTNKSLGVEIPAEKSGFVGYGSLGLLLDTLEQTLSASPYLTGDAFTAADLYVGGLLGFAMQFGLFESRPAFQDYTARINARPAAARAQALDDALMPKTA